MTQYIITHCTAPDDATAIARNNASAFWEDPNWRYSWQHYTLERLVAAFVQRTPRNLLRDRDVLRHFRAVDPATGRLVGYIRWRLPAGRCWEGRQGDGVEEQVPAWPEGQTPDVSAEEREEFEKRAVGADWNPIDYGEEELDHALVPIKNRLLAKKEYLSSYLLPLRRVSLFLTIMILHTSMLLTAVTSPRTFCCPSRESAQGGRVRPITAWHPEGARDGHGHLRHGVRRWVQAV